jgi:hypothetical protein
MADKPSYWFPVKRYGWGWGAPVRWQGWAVLAVYVAALYAGFHYLKPANSLRGFIEVGLLPTVILAIVVVAKGQRPVRWRWGGK